MEELRTRPPRAVLELLNNWMWEIPVEHTPDRTLTAEIIRTIESRADAAECGEALRVAREYLRMFYGQTREP